jgi:hypothetical protein
MTRCLGVTRFRAIKSILNLLINVSFLKRDAREGLDG